jgi:hypothetical protein
MKFISAMTALCLLAIACTTAPAASPTAAPSAVPTTVTTSSPAAEATAAATATAEATPAVTNRPTPSTEPSPTPWLSSRQQCADVLGPDDGRITAVLENGSANGIATINADGSGLAEIVDADAVGIEGPRLVAGDRVLFSSNRSGGQDDWHLYSVPGSGGEVAQVTSSDDYIEFHPSLSADGSVLVYGKAVRTPEGPDTFRDVGIFVSDADGKNERQVTVAPAGAGHGRPDVSPDGQWIAFEQVAEQDVSIFVVNVDGSGLRELTDPALQAYRPRWSPDGKTIAFSNNSHRFASDSANVWLVESDGSGLRQLTLAKGADQAWAPDWSPDGRYLVIIHGADLDVIDTDGVQICKIRAGTAGRFAGDADWGPSATTTAGAADIVCEWARETRCEEIVAALAAAGFDDAIPEFAYGFVPGADSADDIADPDEPCAGAVPLRHSHFFTADGRFGSRDENGDQVDNGTYAITDDGTFVIASECDCIGEVTFHYDIDGDEILFEPVMPECAPQCFAAVWSISVAYPGRPWTRSTP